MGNFASSIGGGDPIQEAMARRGMGVGVTQQVSPASPNFEPGTLPTSIGGQQQPAVAPAGASGSPPFSPAGSPGMPPGSFEAETIVKALDSRLKTLSKIDEAKNVPQKLGGL